MSVGFFEHLKKIEFLPLLSPDPDRACRKAELFCMRGVDTVEIPLRGEGGPETIKALKRCFPSLKIAAGTVLSDRQAAEAADAGADAFISPGWEDSVCREASRRGLPYVPGVFTATEVQNAVRNRCLYLKFFPAAAGGIDYLKSLSAPFFNLGVRFMPSGGINRDNYRAFLELPSVFCVAGSDFESVISKDDTE